jgi:hypothetical protein
MASALSDTLHNHGNSSLAYRNSSFADSIEPTRALRKNQNGTAFFFSAFSMPCRHDVDVCVRLFVCTFGFIRIYVKGCVGSGNPGRA